MDLILFSNLALKLQILLFFPGKMNVFIEITADWLFDKRNSYTISISWLYFDSQLKTRFEQIKPNSKFRKFVDLGLGVACDEPDKR